MQQQCSIDWLQLNTRGVGLSLASSDVIARCRGYIAAGAGAVVSLWCASLASRLFVRRSPVLVHYRNLVAYPCLLAYSAFALLTLY